MSESLIAGAVMARQNVRVVLTGPDGGVKETRLCNTVTAAGKNGAADQLLAAPSLGKPTHMAIGTGTPSGTALGVELDRNVLATKTRSGAVVTMTATWSPGDGTGALTEAGIFDAASVGNMWCSSSFAVVNKGALDTVTISWTLTYT